MACDVPRVLDTICVTSKSLRTSHLFISRETQNYLAMNENASIYIGSKPHESFPMTYHAFKSHPVTFRARASVKSESVYYNLQFWLFLRYFWTSPGLDIFSPETFLGVSTSLVTLRGYLAPFALPRNASQHPICSFPVKPKTASK